MKLAMQKTLSQDKCKYFNLIPSEVQNFVQITTAITYDHKEKSLSISNSGLESKEYTHLYCTDCEKVLIPKILEAPWDIWGGDATLLSLINQWDILKIPEDKINFVGCFLPWNSSHFAGPSATRFIHNPKEHVDVSHPGNKKVTTKKKQSLMTAL